MNRIIVLILVLLISSISTIAQENADDFKVVQLDHNEEILSGRYFSENLNICAEDVLTSEIFYPNNLADRNTIRIIKKPLPCYNKNGERLRYYDNEGVRLAQPVYSDLPVYITRPEDTLDTIAQNHEICLINLLRINGFPVLPEVGGLELLIPPSHPCPSDIQAIPTNLFIVEDISQSLNICMSELLPLNPQLPSLQKTYTASEYSNFAYLRSIKPVSRWIIIPVVYDECYIVYDAINGESLYDLEESMNICHEEFIFSHQNPDLYGDYASRAYDWEYVIDRNTTIFIDKNAPPCYNDSGERLYYPDYYQSLENNTKSIPRGYTSMQIYTIQYEDTVYTISQDFNVCVYDLFETNTLLEEYTLLQIGQRIFIPDTRPCYDEATGLPLIYEDEAGQALAESIVGEHLVHYGGQSLDKISRYYNVCVNRIKDANSIEATSESNSLGWIIPTDRPSCYDGEGNLLRYICYAQPIDMNADYSTSDPPISFDNDGTYCYAQSDPTTVVWYENQPYKIESFFGALYEGSAFSEWCYGVSLDEIRKAKQETKDLDIDLGSSRLTPKSKRKCYVEYPEILDSHSTIHTVQSGETLSSIAKQYDMPYQLIASANDIKNVDMIWDGQKLIIPDGFRWRGLIAFGGSVSAIGLAVILLYRHKRSHKKKGIPKNDSL